MAMSGGWSGGHAVPVRDEPAAAVHPIATFAAGAHSDPDTSSLDCRIMKQIFPVVLALIPLAAVVGACISCP